MVLYSYCIPVDDGAAPNPFWGTCTLAICKPVIRRLAKRGDWIVATGSKKYGLDNYLVYAMKVSDSLSFSQYYVLCNNDLQLKKKIPNWNSKDIKRKVGDCIYDFSSSPFKQIKGVHNLDNIERDLGGKRVLLSNHFYYFGSAPIKLPDNLLPIVRQGQGHKSKANANYVEAFVNWIDTLPQYRNKVNALPYGFDFWQTDDCIIKCSQRHISEDDEDERLGDC